MGKKLNDCLFFNNKGNPCYLNIINRFLKDFKIN